MDDYYQDLDAPYNKKSTDENSMSDSPLYRDAMDNGVYNTSAFNYNFKVKLYMKNIIGLIFCALLPFLFMLFSLTLVIEISKRGNELFANMYIGFLILFSLIMIALVWNGAGKSLEVMGRGIVIRKWFLFKEEITIADVTKCNVVYGLTVYNRYHTTTYNNVEIYYNGNSKIVFSDVSYEGWNKLVDYMTENGKVVTIDATSPFVKKVGSWLEKHNRKW